MRTKRDIVTAYLVADAKAGNVQSLDRLIRLWATPLRTFVYRQTGSREDLADIMQEVWVAISRGLSRLDDPVRFKHWAYRIARNKSVDWIRKRQTSRALFEEVDNPDHVPAEEGEDVPAAHVALRRELSRMPAERRQLLILFYLEELSVTDIARVLGIPEGTVKSRLFHARQALKQQLEETP